MKQKYYAVFSDGVNRYASTEEFTDSLTIHTVYAYGRNMAAWKAVKELSEQYSMLDLSPLAVFEQREIDMLTFVYYRIPGIEACEWLRYIIENASRDCDMYWALTRDRSCRKDEHLINVVSYLVEYAEKHADDNETEFD